MKKLITVEVLRPMIGDKPYARGDRRELPKATAEKFAASGAVRIIKGKVAGGKPAKPKAAGAPKNKAEAAPENKAEGTPENKGADETDVQTDSADEAGADSSTTDTAPPAAE